MCIAGAQSQLGLYLRGWGGPFFTYYFFFLHTSHLVRTVTACTCAETPRSGTRCALFRPDRLRGQPGRPPPPPLLAARLGLTDAHRNAETGRTHRDPLLLLTPRRAAAPLLLRRVGRQIRPAARFDFDPVIVAGSIVTITHRISPFIVADELASTRNSNDLTIFSAAPAHRRPRPVSESGISADGRASGPIRDDAGFSFFFFWFCFHFLSGRGGTYGTGEVEMRCATRPRCRTEPRPGESASVHSLLAPALPSIRGGEGRSEEGRGVKQQPGLFKCGPTPTRNTDWPTSCRFSLQPSDTSAVLLLWIITGNQLIEKRNREIRIITLKS